MIDRAACSGGFLSCVLEVDQSGLATHRPDQSGLASHRQAQSGPATQHAVNIDIHRVPLPSPGAFISLSRPPVTGATFNISGVGQMQQ